MQFTEFLETVPEFSEFNRHDLEILEKILVVRDYPDGHEFIHEGKSADGMYLVVEGEVAVSHCREEKQGLMELNRMRPGELFGLVALIDHGRRVASCRAMGPTRIASLPRSAFELLYSANSPLAEHFLKIVARQLMRDYRSLTQVLRRSIFETGQQTKVPKNLR